MISLEHYQITYLFTYFLFYRGDLLKACYFFLEKTSSVILNYPHYLSSSVEGHEGQNSDHGTF